MEDLFISGDWNQSILIAKDKAFFKDTDRIILSGDAEVRLDMLPKPSIKIYVENIIYFDFTKTCQLSGLAFQPLDLQLEQIEKSIKGSMSVNNVLSSKSFVWSPYEPIIGIGNNDTQIQYVVFHLFNFKKISREVSLEYKNWIVELQPSIKYEEHFEQLQAHGGYALTHHVYLKKVDNTSFSIEDAEKIILALFQFFSFSKGDWCGPVCLVGFDLLNKTVWEEWYSPRVSSFSDPISWFDELYPKQLEDLFSGFMECWFNDDKNDILRKGIYWYLNAIHSNVDVGIVLAQTALESMSRGYITNVLNKDPMRKDAKQNIEQLFFNLGFSVPDEITEGTPNLKRLAEELKWDNALGAFISIRNNLVHPQKRYHKKFSSIVYWETQDLGLWYLELSLLKLCNYYGKYFNRLTLEKIKGNVEDIPWKK